MIANHQPYPEYKESGEDWLGLLPAHWKQLRAKCLFREVDERSQTGREELLSVSHLTGVTPRSQKTITMFLAKSNVGHKTCRPDDVVINTMWAWMGALGVARHTGIVSPAYGVYRPLADSGLMSRYADHLLRTPIYAGEYLRRSTGVNSSRLRLYPEQFLRTPVVIPPPEEQAAMVRFLDYANGRLERAIRAKRKVIALLNEQKQAIIHRAVTRGLDPTVPLKPAGIPWLGDIPAHWEVTALRRYWRVTDCKHLTVPFVEDGIPLASVVEVQSFTLNLGLCKKTTPRWYRMLIDGDRKPQRGDLIYCRNASVGACALVDTDIDFAMGQDVCLIRSAKQNQHFLNFLLHSPFMDQQLELLLVGSTFKRINVADIKALTVLVPPRNEQDAICSHLNSELRAYDTAIARTEREIALMQEYRTRLTADIVTGKLDVRAAAVKLPGAIETIPEGELDNSTSEGVEDCPIQ